MMEITKAIHEIFLDASNRPKITPRHETGISVMLEDRYTPSQVKTGLRKLVEKKILVSKKDDVRGAKFFYLKIFDKKDKRIKKKIDYLSYWINRYSNVKITKMIGDHLHDLVKAELRAQNFQILKEKNVREFEGKKWTKTSHSLDLIVKHKEKKLVMGLEIKNTLYPPPKSEVLIKINMCKFFGIIPVFASRWLEIHRKIIDNSEGFLWQFKKQLYPRGQERFVEIIRQRFKLPVEVGTTLPPSAIKDFERWISKF